MSVKSVIAGDTSHYLKLRVQRYIKKARFQNIFNKILIILRKGTKRKLYTLYTYRIMKEN